MLFYYSYIFKGHKTIFLFNTYTYFNFFEKMFIFTYIYAIITTMEAGKQCCSFEGGDAYGYI